jgi:periplasmic divalent cation tolerance protein
LTWKERRNEEVAKREDTKQLAMAPLIQVLTTTDNRVDAQKIARTLVEKKVAACVQIIGPIVSTYWWKGKVETADEWLCLVKSEKGLFVEVEKAIKEIHPYETPEVIATPIVAASKDYLAWLSSEVRAPQ